MIYKRMKVPPAMTPWNRPRIVVWPCARGYRWALLAGNGRNMGGCNGLYSRERDAYAAAVRVVALLRGALVIERQARPEPERIEVGRHRGTELGA